MKIDRRKGSGVLKQLIARTAGIGIFDEDYADAVLILFAA